MEQELIKLYEKNASIIENSGKNFNRSKIVGPFLISPGQKYQEQRKKLLIVGSETSGWFTILPDIQKGIELYKKQEQGKNIINNTFWDLIRKVEKAYGITKYSSIWTNMNKFDLHSSLLYTLFIPKMTECDYLLLEEIRILKPEVVIFFTNYIFDKRIHNVFKGVKFIEVHGFKIRDLSKLQHTALPVESYRTYHPNHLKNKQRLESDLIELIKEIGNKVNL